MAEILGRAAAEAAANRKVLIDTQGKSFTAVVEMPVTWTAANGDTVATGVVLPKGARLLCPVTLSNSPGTASLTLSVGLRNNATKVTSDATAIVNAAAITAAGTGQINTGTKLTVGQRYVLADDSEIFLTFGGATPTPSQAIRVEIPYVF